MNPVNFENRKLSRVVDEYIRTRRNTEWPISVVSAVKAVRYVCPSPSHSDRDLASLVITAAIAQGRNVAFDAAPSGVEMPAETFEARNHG
jgi:hypothetical protein